AMTEMYGESIKMGEHDFSAAIDKQKHQEAELADSTVDVTAVTVPSLVLTWPFAVMCGGIMAAGEVVDDSVDCYKVLREVSGQSYDLITGQNDVSVITRIDEIYPDFVVSRSDKKEGERRVIGRKWRCKTNNTFNELDDVEISIGVKSGRMVLASLYSRWLRYL
ncbi:MAG: hypothetical protein P8X93_09445, partial [Gammaproteobacteria bacterium]